MAKLDGNDKLEELLEKEVISSTESLEKLGRVGAQAKGTDQPE